MRNHRPEELPELDAAPAAERTAHHTRALLRLWNVAASHPLTRDRLPKTRAAEVTGANVLERWPEIPVDAPADHSRYIASDGEHQAFRADRNAALIVCSSGGSTGPPKLLVNTYEETLRNARFQGKGYRLAGITSCDTVATLGGSGIYAIDYCIYHALAQIGCTIVPFVDFRRVDDNYKSLEELQVSVLLALPSKLYPLLDYMEARDKILAGVRLVVTGGEPVSKQLKNRLINRLGSELRFGSTFCTSDHGSIGYQCRHCGEGEYHLHEELQYVELTQPAADGSASELVVSNLHWSCMPVVRLRTGDRAVWTDEQGCCPCGKTSRKVRLVGRTADTILIGGETMSDRIFTELADRVGIVENRLKVFVRAGSDGRDTVEIALDGALQGRYENELRETLMTDSTFARLVNEERVTGPKFVAARELRDAPGYGKLRVLHDMRR